MGSGISPLVLVCVISVSPALAQWLSGERSWHVGEHEATIVFGRPHPAATVIGAPYSADQVQHYSRTLADGTSTTTSNTIGHFYRDSRGRTRTERASKPAPIWLTEVFDPVAGFAYLLDDQNKIAHRMALQLGAADKAQPRMKHFGATESLGTQSIEGVPSVGTRITGLDFTLETWVSEELHETLLTKSSNGYSTKLVNLSRVDPAPALFRPPADYTVVDDQEGFTLKVRFQ